MRRPTDLLEVSAPGPVADLAGGCIRYVERSVGVQLDYTPETLPLLDHYLEQARGDATNKEETLTLLAQTAGAYLGEVIRRKHPSWWRLEGDDPMEWRLEFEAVYLAFSPMLFIREALLRPPSAAPAADPDDEDDEDEGDREEEEIQEPTAEDEAEAAPGPIVATDSGDGDAAPLILLEEDRMAVAARLAELPPVREDEYYATSTRLEVIDIAVDTIRSRRIAEGEEEPTPLEPADYELDD
ncbi:MAG TPA: DUF6278 family protein [Candidatus Nanopelagicales bacterium]|nr:DUF6278 family protein [Candidatus Nanopelagicales bacterium]